ncbi:hypothetical protein BDF22DRAFT_388998 [Syncephalis plumigaleata]|nr:hypothetical protein BDF22DRAFT_388998 [Syncephalis plumigaleata]
MSTQSAHLADKLQQGERLLSRQLECTVNSAHSTLQLGRAYFYFPPNSGEVLPATREDCNTYTLCANNENSLLLAGIAVFKLEPINGKCLHEIYAAVAFDTGAEHNEPPQLCARFIVTERGVDFSCSPERLKRYYERSISHALRPMQSPQLIQGKSFDATFALECWMDRSSSTRPFELRVSLLPSMRGVAVTYLIWSIWSYHRRGGEGQPMSVRSSTIDVDEDEYDDDFAYDNRMIDHFSQHMESMHLATGLDSQHAELIREHQNESYTSGSTGTCVSMTIANNHPLVTLTGRHQYTHEGTIEMEPTDSIDHGRHKNIEQPIVVQKTRQLLSCMK